MKREDDTTYSVGYHGHVLYLRFARSSWSWTAYLPGVTAVRNPALSLAIRQVTREWIERGRRLEQSDSDAFPIQGSISVTSEDVLGWAAEEERNRMHALFSGVSEGFTRLKARLVETPCGRGLRLRDSDRIRVEDLYERELLRVSFGRDDVSYVLLSVYDDGTYLASFNTVMDSTPVHPRLEAYERCLAFIREYELIQRPV